MTKMKIIIIIVSITVNFKDSHMNFIIITIRNCQYFKFIIRFMYLNCYLLIKHYIHQDFNADIYLVFFSYFRFII